MTREKPFKKIIDALTGEETIIYLTADEIAEMEKQQKEIESQAAAEVAAKIAAEAKKQAVLAKLGLDAEEVAALLA